MAFKKERSIEQCIGSSRFAQALSEEVANLPWKWIILASCLYEKSISAYFDAWFLFIQFLDFFFYHMDISFASYKFSRDFKFRSSRKTRISKTSAQHRSVLSKFVLWGLPREYKWPILKFPQEYNHLLILAYARSLSSTFKIFQPMF